MEVDTGASRSTVSEQVYKKYLSGYPVENANVVLKSYCNEIVPVVGMTKVPVHYNEQSFMLDLIIVKGDRPALLGRDWLKFVKLDWMSIFTVARASKAKKPAYPKEMEHIIGRYGSVFKPDNVGIKEFRACIKLKPEAKPVYQKARPVPYSMIQGVEKEYERLCKAGILYPVEHSNWGTPVVNVVKPNDSIRVCGDYKQINELIEDDGYKLPNAQDLFAKLARGGPYLRYFRFSTSLGLVTSSF